MYIVFLGAPGAGKGTQAVNIADNFEIAHIASGDLFRQAQSSGTDLGNLAKSYMGKGLLVPDDITVRMVLERIVGQDCSNGFILDGFPRTLAQAQSLETALEADHQSIDCVIYIKVSEEELVKRLGGRWICRNCQTPYNINDMVPRTTGVCDRCNGELYQRDDDAEETVRKRINVYFAQTAPLINYYTEKSKLLEINGSHSINEVKEEILVALAK